MSKLYLSVVIPSFNEMANLRKGVLDKIERFLNSRKYEYEVIIVDDGSSDGSVEFVKKFAKENPRFRVIENPHMGKAGAVTTGMLSGKGEYVLFTDMDQATPIEELDNVMPFFDKGFDVVIGTRSNDRKGSPLTRKLISMSAIVLRKLIVGIYQISDTQCGFKAFKREAAQDLFGKINKLHKGFKKISGSSVSSGFDVEVLYLAAKSGYKIKEVPVEWLYVETRRVNPIKDSISGVVDLVKIRSNIISGKYK